MSSPTIVPSPDLDIHAAQPWMRLYREEKVIGYARDIAEDKRLFSKDGYGWSADELSFDFELPQIPLKLSSSRIFHGDMVTMPEHCTAQSMGQMVVLLGADGQIYLFNLKTNSIHPLEALWPPPSRPRVHRIFGSIVGQRDVSSLITRRLKNYVDSGATYYRKSMALALSIVFGGSLLAGVQFSLFSYVGPLVPFTGGFLGALGFWSISRQRDWYVLQRAKMLKMSFHVGLMLLLLTLISSVFAQAIELGTAHFWLKALAQSILGFAFGLISSLLAADIVAWRTGGYADESHETVGFRRD